MEFNIGGKGMYLWRIRVTELGNIPAIVAKAKDAGLSHVIIKIAESVSGYNYIDGVDKAKELADALKVEGITPLGFQYIYGQDPRGEALTAVRRMRETGCLGFVIDAETEYLVLPENKVKAAEYMSYLDFPEPIGFSSFRYPELQWQMPWAEFLAGCDFIMPQVYWMQATNAGAQLAKSYAQYRKISDLPYIPTGVACCESGWCPTSEQIADFVATANSLELPGFNFWEYAATVKDGFWDVVAGAEWIPPAPLPPSDCEAEIKAAQIEILDRAIEALENIKADL